MDDVELCESEVVSDFDASYDENQRLIAAALKQQGNANFASFLKKWEQASQMRQWHQKLKRTLAEEFEKKSEKELRKKFEEENPDKAPFTDPLNDEQQQIVMKESDEAFEPALKERIDQIGRKAEFLAKLEVPQAFKQAKRDDMVMKLGKSLSTMVGNKQ